MLQINIPLFAACGINAVFKSNFSFHGKQNNLKFIKNIYTLIFPKNYNHIFGCTSWAQGMLSSQYNISG